MNTGTSDSPTLVGTRLRQMLHWIAASQCRGSYGGEPDPRIVGYRVIRLGADVRFFVTAADIVEPRACWAFSPDDKAWAPVRKLALPLGLIEEEWPAMIDAGHPGVAMRLTDHGWAFIGGYERRVSLTLLGGR